MGVLVTDRLMPVVPTPIRHRRQCAGVAVLCRYLPHHILARPRLAPNVGEAEEGERGTIRLRMVSPIWPVVAEMGGPRRLTMYVATVDCATLNPSLRSSPWMRGAPQSKFSILICRISIRSSKSICGRPPRERDFHRQ